MFRKKVNSNWERDYYDTLDCVMISLQCLEDRCMVKRAPKRFIRKLRKLRKDINENLCDERVMVGSL